MKKDSLTPTVKTRTLGCKVNFCDTNAIFSRLAAAGFAAAEGGGADVEIVNTCAVTARGVRKARILIRHIRAVSPQAVIVVTGCGARMGAFDAMPEIDALCPALADVAAWLSARFGLPVAPPGGGLDSERKRAFVKVQDGCDSFCTYCVVPYVRGAPRSLPPAEALDLVRAAIDRGYREVVLSGVHLGRWGQDLAEGRALPGLLESIAALPGDFRVRLSSIEPLEVTDRLLAVMASSGRFCPHLPVPLQSGSDRILAAMKRPYGSSEYLRLLDRARAALANPAFTTDIIVGFPGETQDDHAATLALMRRAGFARAHVFVYSPRPGTAAYAFPGRVHGAVAHERSLEVRALAAETARRFRAALVGTTAEVIPEAVITPSPPSSPVSPAAPAAPAAPATLEGLCRRYQRVRLCAPVSLMGRLVSVKVTGQDDSTLVGDIL